MTSVVTLQWLFPDEPILEQREYAQGYEDHASDVWRVRTSRREVVVRRSRVTELYDNDFFYGCHGLFGLQPADLAPLAGINTWLSEHCTIPVPRVLQTAQYEGRSYAIVERMAGRTLQTFKGQSPELLLQLGEMLGTLHRQTSRTAGRLDFTWGIPAEAFHSQLANVLAKQVERFHQQTDIADALPTVIADMADLPFPEVMVPIMLDWSPEQFLTDGTRLTALVDTEAYVWGPAALDLVNLEYILSTREAVFLAQGYERVQAMTPLARVRRVYRYFARALGAHGSMPLETALDWPSLFP